MYIESLAKQGREKLHEGLASIEPSKLVQLRKEQLRNCFVNSYDMGSRFQIIAKIHGTEYINDASSCSPNATWFTLEMMQKPVIWITHGHESKEELVSLIPIAVEKVDSIICVGENIETVAQVFAGIITNIVSAPTLEDAVQYVYSIANEEKVVLYSPTCLLGENNDEQGLLFKKSVNQL